MLMIGVLNSKGGVGKTTLTTSLAARAAQDYKRVCIVDTDPQQGSCRWHKFRSGNGSGNPSILAGDSNIHDVVEKLQRTGWDVVFFDGAPGALEQSELVIREVDFVLIPLKAGDQDLSSSEYTVGLCKQEGKPYMLALNEVRPPRGKTQDKRAQEVLNILEELKQPVASRAITERVAHLDALNLGTSVFDMKGQDEAKKDIEVLYQELMKAAGSAG